MLTLKLPMAPEAWELGSGVSITMRPLGPGLIERVHVELRAIMTRALAGEDLLEGIPVTAAAIPDIESEAGKEALRSLFFYISIAIAGIMEWEGVGDEEGNPVKPTPEKIAILLLSQNTIFEAFRQKFAEGWGALEQEGNASGPLQNGRSVTAPNTAKTVKNSARRARTGKKTKTGNTARSTKTPRKP